MLRFCWMPTRMPVTLVDQRLDLCLGKAGGEEAAGSRPSAARSRGARRRPRSGAAPRAGDRRAAMRCSGRTGCPARATCGSGRDRLRNVSRLASAMTLHSSAEKPVGGRGCHRLRAAGDGRSEHVVEVEIGHGIIPLLILGKRWPSSVDGPPTSAGRRACAVVAGTSPCRACPLGIFESDQAEAGA